MQGLKLCQNQVEEQAQPFVHSSFIDAEIRIGADQWRRTAVLYPSLLCFTITHLGRGRTAVPNCLKHPQRSWRGSMQRHGAP